MIVKSGSHFLVKTEAGDRTLGTHATRGEAVKQLQAIEANKHRNMAHGGDVPFEVHSEHPTYFMVSKAGGKPFAMAKAAMSKDQITKVQRYAHGGTVQRMAVGGDPVPVSSDVPAVNTPATEARVANLPSFVTPEAKAYFLQQIDPLNDLAKKGDISPYPSDMTVQPTEASFGALKIDPDQWSKTKNFVNKAIDTLTTTKPLEAIPTTPGEAPPVAPAVPIAPVAPVAPVVPVPKPVVPAKPFTFDQPGAVSSTAPRSPEEYGANTLPTPEKPVDNSPEAVIARQTEAQAKLASDTAQLQETAIADRNQRLKAFNDSLSKNNQDIQDVYKTRPSADAYWAKQSTGERITAALGMLMGGIGVMGGHANTAVQYVQDQIKQDVDQQARQKSGLVEALMQKGHDLASAHNLAEVAATSNLADKTAAMANRMQAGQAKDNALMASYQLKLAAEKRAIDNAKTVSEINVNRANANKANVEAGKGSLELQLTRRALSGAGGESAGTPANRPTTLADERERGITIDGKRVYASTGPNADKIKEARVGYSNYQMARKDLQNFINNNGTSAKWPGDTKRAAEQKVQRLQNAYFASKGIKLSALSQSEIDNLRSQFPDLASFVQNPQRALDDLSASVDQDHQNLVEGYTGYRPSIPSSRKMVP